MGTFAKKKTIPIVQTQKMKTFIFFATVVVLTAYSSPVPNPKPQISWNFDYSLDCYALSANKITMEVEDTTIMIMTIMEAKTTIMEEEDFKEVMEVEYEEMGLELEEEETIKTV